jgi:alpha-ketoglutarate-dependent 2,4-dichlorophenoxyacetate dioxygenase
MGIEIRQIRPLFVGEVSGIDLSRPLTSAAIRALWEAIDRYAVSHDPHLDDEQLLEFARNFGELAAEPLPKAAAGVAGDRRHFEP